VDAARRRHDRGDRFGPEGRLGVRSRPLLQCRRGSPLASPSRHPGLLPRARRGARAVHQRQPRRPDPDRQRVLRRAAAHRPPAGRSARRRRRARGPLGTHGRQPRRPAAQFWRAHQGHGLRRLVARWLRLARDLAGRRHPARQAAEADPDRRHCARRRGAHPRQRSHLPRNVEPGAHHAAARRWHGSHRRGTGRGDRRRHRLRPRGRADSAHRRAGRDRIARPAHRDPREDRGRLCRLHDSPDGSEVCPRRLLASRAARDRAGCRDLRDGDQGRLRGVTAVVGAGRPDLRRHQLDQSRHQPALVSLARRSLEQGHPDRRLHLGRGCSPALRRPEPGRAARCGDRRRRAASSRLRRQGRCRSVGGVEQGALLPRRLGRMGFHPGAPARRSTPCCCRRMGPSTSPAST